MYSEKVQYSSFSLGLNHGSHLACCNRLPSSKISCFAVLCLCWFLLPVGTTCLSLFSFWSSLLMCYILAVSQHILWYGRWETEVLTLARYPWCPHCSWLKITFMCCQFLDFIPVKFCASKMYFTSYLYVRTTQLLRIHNSHSSNLTQVSYNLCKALFLTKDRYASLKLLQHSVS